MNPAQILQRLNPSEANKQISLTTSSGWSHTAMLLEKVILLSHYFIQNSELELEHHNPTGASGHNLGRDQGAGCLWHHQQWIQGDRNL